MKKVEDRRTSSGGPLQIFDGDDLGQSSKAAIVSAILCRWMLIGLPQGGTVYGQI